MINLLPCIVYRKIPLKPTETRRGVYVSTPCKFLEEKKNETDGQITENQLI